MIYESWAWKMELYDSFRFICKFRQLKRISEKSRVKVEKAIFLSSYVIRKLNEAEKLPPRMLSQEVSVLKFTRKNRTIDHVNWHKIDENYEMERPEKATNTINYFLNQIIHSFTFALGFDECSRLDMIFVNSDKTKDSVLYGIPIETILAQILKISEGNMAYTHKMREVRDISGDQKTPGSMKLKSGNYVYPEGFDLESEIKKSMNGDIYCRTNL